MKLSHYLMLLIFSIGIGIGYYFYSAKSVEPVTPKGLLYQEVMDIHDEAMPLMTDINNQMKALKNERKKELPADLDRSAATYINELEQAEEAMMDWMANFNRDKIELDDEAMPYLKDEKIKITAINSQMHEAVYETKEFLQTITQVN